MFAIFNLKKTDIGTSEMKGIPVHRQHKTL